MNHADFSIGTRFRCGERTWRCTDVGTRTVIAIALDVAVAGSVHRRLNEAEATQEGWFNGPPYAVAESVFDENDLPGCEPDA